MAALYLHSLNPGKEDDKNRCNDRKEKRFALGWNEKLVWANNLNTLKSIPELESISVERAPLVKACKSVQVVFLVSPWSACCLFLLSSKAMHCCEQRPPPNQYLCVFLWMRFWWVSRATESSAGLRCSASHAWQWRWNNLCKSWRQNSVLQNSYPTPCNAWDFRLFQKDKVLTLQIELSGISLLCINAGPAPLHGRRKASHRE